MQRQVQCRTCQALKINFIESVIMKMTIQQRQERKWGGTVERLIPSGGTGVGARSHNIGVSSFEAIDEVPVRFFLIFSGLKG